MYTIQRLRALFNERLTVAAEEIFGVIETTIAQYEEDICLSKQEITRQLLDIRALKWNLEQQRSDAQQPQEDPEPQEDPKPPQIKEEHEDLWASLEGEQLQEPGEADIIKFTVSSSVKTEREPECPVPKALPSTSAEQMKTAPDGKDCGMSDLDGVCQPTSDCSVIESDDGGSGSGFRITRRRQAGSRIQELKRRNKGRKKRTFVRARDTPLSSPGCEVVVTSLSTPSYGTETGATQSNLQTLKSKGEHPGEGQISYGHKHSMDMDSTDSSNQKSPRENITLSCKVCGKTFYYKELLVKHAHVHANNTGLCGVCGQFYENVSTHLRFHMPAKGCRICGQQFERMFDLKKHMGATHRGEKSFKCHFCYKGFTARRDLDRHFLTHTGEKPFSCNFCGKSFNRAQNMRTHMRTHTGEKPYCCPLCGQRFTYNVVLKKHMKMHSGT